MSTGALPGAAPPLLSIYKNREGGQDGGGGGAPSPHRHRHIVAANGTVSAPLPPLHAGGGVAPRAALPQPSRVAFDPFAVAIADPDADTVVVDPLQSPDSGIEMQWVPHVDGRELV